MAIKKKKLVFNRENVLRLAKDIFSEKNNKIKMIRLCRGRLEDQCPDNKLLHCVIGETYSRFVGSIPKTISTETAIHALAKVALLKNKNNKTIFVNSMFDLMWENDGSNDDDYYTRAKEVSEMLERKIAPLLK